MVAYNADVIVQFAEALYKRAARIVLAYAIRGFVLGGVAGLVLGASAGGNAQGMLAFFLAAVGTVIGVSMSQEKAAALRLQAQQALCQVQIEQNTRVMAQAAQRASPLEGVASMKVA